MALDPRYDLWYHKMASHASHLEKTLPIRHRIRFLFWIFIPYFSVLTIGVRLIRLVRRKTGNRLSAWLIRYYFRFYFMFRGTATVNTKTEEAPTFDKPTLILGPRTHLMSSLMVYKEFKSPIVIPLHWMFSRYKYFWWMPFSLMGPLFSSMSYDDAPLDSSVDNIKIMLESGYPVMAHINYGIFDMVHSERLWLYRSIFQLLSLDIDIYFLHIAGMENYPHSSFLNPTLVEYELVPARTVFDGYDMTKSREVLRAIALFYGIAELALVDRH